MGGEELRCGGVGLYSDGVDGTRAEESSEGAASHGGVLFSDVLEEMLVVERGGEGGFGGRGVLLAGGDEGFLLWGAWDCDSFDFWRGVAVTVDDEG